MWCTLCVQKSEEVIHLFHDDGIALNIAEIITKHFWLQPSANDSKTNVVCTSCWKALDSFHRFYLQVEEAHVRLQNKETIEKDKLKKKENIIAALQICDSSTEPFEVGLSESEIKLELEVKEDGDLILQPHVLLKIHAEPKENLALVRKDSIDSNRSDEHEPTPPCSTRSLYSVEKCCVDDDNNGADNDWQNQDSDFDDDDEDSDYEDTTPCSKAKKNTKEKQSPKPTAKRGRAGMGEHKESSCKKKRTTEEQAKKMERIHEYDEMIAQNMKLACDICSKAFTNFAILKRHYRTVHNQCGYASCCGKKFRKRGILVDHIYTHQNPEYFKCEKCGKVLASRKNLDCHMLTHNTEKQRIFQCDQCPMSFYTKPLLNRHIQTHISERNIKCPDCEKYFSTQDILRTHINNVHNAAYNRICDQCGKLFRRPDAFRRHQLEHDGITQPLVPCEKCSVKLTSKYGLKRHMESMHPETETKHICNECGKVAPSAAALQRHISYMHKMERKFKCPMCDKAFKKTGGLKKMLCILCVQPSEEVLAIFKGKGMALNLCEIIRKHFWLEPNANDVNASAICQPCLDKLNSFHLFYLQVEDAHARLQNTAHIILQKQELSTEIKLEPEEIVEPMSTYLIVELPKDAQIVTPSLSTPAVEYSKRIRKKTACKTYDSCGDQSNPHVITDQDSTTGTIENLIDSTDKNKVNRLQKKTIKSPLSTNKTLRKLSPENKLDDRDKLIAKYFKLTCETCLMDFPKFSYLMRHYIVAHKRSGYATCCNIRMYKRCQLIDHIKRHQNPDFFKCDLCYKVLSNRQNLHIHMQTHTIKDRERNYHCDKCELSFHTKQLLKRHWQTHIHGSNVQCPHCNKFYSTEFLLRRHINSVHNTTCKSCDVCGMSFKWVKALRQHKLEHNEIFEKYHQQAKESMEQDMGVEGGDVIID